MVSIMLTSAGKIFLCISATAGDEASIVTTIHLQVFLQSIDRKLPVIVMVVVDRWWRP